MTEQEAKQIALKHLTDNPLPDKKYRWITTTPHCSEEGWVFRYRFECLEDIPVYEQNQFAGAPAFLVQENGDIRNLTWKEMQRLIKGP